MAKPKLKCPKCTRTFSMAAHLARHMSTIHATGAKKKAAAKAPAKRKGKKKPGPKPGARAMKARSVPGDEGARVLAEMQSYHANLLETRGAIDGKIGALEQAMIAMGAAGQAPRRMGRPAGAKKVVRAASAVRAAKGVRAGTLKDAVINVLRATGTPMSPRTLSVAVKKSGYKTKAKDLTKAISNVLPTIESIKRVGHGMYSA